MKSYLLSLPVAAALLAAGASTSHASISITTPGSPIVQDFEALDPPGSSSALPAGWTFLETGTAANTTYSQNNGSSTTGDTYSYGGSNADRAFGSLQSGALASRIGAEFTNNTGSVISQLNIAFRGEQWRLGALGREDRLDFQISFDATDATAGSTTSAGLADSFTWINVNVLDFIAPLTAGSTGAKNGNENFVNISNIISGLNIANGATFWIRFLDFNADGADDGLAIDDFSITAVAGTAPAAVPEAASMIIWASIVSGAGLVAWRRKVA